MECYTNFVNDRSSDIVGGGENGAFTGLSCLALSNCCERKYKKILLIIAVAFTFVYIIKLPKLLENNFSNTSQKINQINNRKNLQLVLLEYFKTSNF